LTTDVKWHLQIPQVLFKLDPLHQLINNQFKKIQHFTLSVLTIDAKNIDFHQIINIYDVNDIFVLF